MCSSWGLKTHKIYDIQRVSLATTPSQSHTHTNMESPPEARRWPWSHEGVKRERPPRATVVVDFFGLRHTQSMVGQNAARCVTSMAHESLSHTETADAPQLRHRRGSVILALMQQRAVPGPAVGQLAALMR